MTTARGRGQWLWTPFLVVLLGLLSIAMLVWIDRVGERQRMDFARADALMAIRMRVTTAHLWVEEGLAHQPEDLKSAWADLAVATRLADGLLAGGTTETGSTLAPLRDPAARQLAEEVRRLLLEFEKNSRERAANPDADRGPLWDQDDVIFDELQRRATELEAMVKMRQAADHVRSRRLTLGIFLAWTVFVAAATTGITRRERRRERVEAALHASRDELEARVAERTQELSALNGRLVEELRERQRAEESLTRSQAQLRDLSSRLLTAQEMERRRIAAELHDHLGHALALLKLRLGQTRRECRVAAPSCQAAAIDECQALSTFIDQIIEDVRRISRDLSPAVLEDMGLSAALRWLVDTRGGHAGLQVASAIADIDHLLPRGHHIHAFRIVQEALTNAAKHARARGVRLVVDRDLDRLSLVVEDDGAGFDAQQVARRNGSARGLGLATMEERARMLGGALTVCSRAGRGTRIALSVPVTENGGG
jgi:signal transduction histidine kinase